MGVQRRLKKRMMTDPPLDCCSLRECTDLVGAGARVRLVVDNFVTLFESASISSNQRLQVDISPPQQFLIAAPSCSAILLTPLNVIEVLPPLRTPSSRPGAPRSNPQSQNTNNFAPSFGFVWVVKRRVATVGSRGGSWGVGSEG